MKSALAAYLKKKKKNLIWSQFIKIRVDRPLFPEWLQRSHHNNLHKPVSSQSEFRQNLPDFASFFFSSPREGKYCSLMRGCELWCALTAWPIRLTASLRLDFRPVEGELSTGPQSHFLSCWELESCHGDRPQKEQVSGSTELVFFPPGWGGGRILDSTLLCLLDYLYANTNNRTEPDYNLKSPFLQLCCFHLTWAWPF